MSYPRLVENLIESLMRLPGIGRRSAERMVFWLLDNPEETSKELSDNIINLKEKLHFCRICNNLSETEICLICSDPARDNRTICIVENPKDLLAIERTGIYRGHYHVLLGAISPMDGRGPNDLKTESLMHKIKTNNIQEVVIATDPDTEGEMTALHLTKELKLLGVKITRIGFGIPVGSSVEYADLSTLSMSLKSRREIFKPEMK